MADHRSRPAARGQRRRQGRRAAGRRWSLRRAGGGTPLPQRRLEEGLVGGGHSPWLLFAEWRICRFGLRDFRLGYSFVSCHLYPIHSHDVLILILSSPVPHFCLILVEVFDKGQRHQPVGYSVSSLVSTIGKKDRSSTTPLTQHHCDTQTETGDTGKDRPIAAAILP